MTKTLREAIEGILMHRTPKTQAALREAYEESRESLTETSKRIEFLEACLETGVSKREAARMLVAHDSRIGQKTAETLVYFNFSGRYQTTKRGRRVGRENDLKPLNVGSRIVADIEDDESIL